MNKKIIFGTQLQSYKGIIYFVCLLFFFFGLWKIVVYGNFFFIHFPWEVDKKIKDDYLFFFGKDITPAWATSSYKLLTDAIAGFVRLFPNTENLKTSDYYLYFPNGKITISIVWGCTGIKHLFIFTCIMACYQGTWRKKIWYIPVGCLILTVYNVIRIGLIVLLTNGHPQRFGFLHDRFFNYIYYTIIFLLWLYWEEQITKNTIKNDS
jgi:exosortase/archaeosortase family protein